MFMKYDVLSVGAALSAGAKEAVGELEHLLNELIGAQAKIRALDAELREERMMRDRAERALNIVRLDAMNIY